MVGTTISHYKVIEKLGAGGMGEVYLAEDSRLDRKVALKILPQHLSERADLRERFEREARAVSSLNHPHICTLYDIGKQDSIHYLVMEHLEGETLAARLEKGALPLEQTLQYAIQIADALDKAHRQGVVHRDLKPGNLMLTKSGAKLLDFGLAKLQAVDTPTNLSALPTEQADLTAEGTILGTLQYMAPEQLEGKEADSRTDIFAFGAVLYEMATGKKAFEGKSQASLIGAIMEKDPPPMTELQSMTPPVLDWVVKRCLAKEPDERVQSAADLTAELKWSTEEGAQAGSFPAVPTPTVWKRAIPWGMTGLALLMAAVAIWSLMSPSPPLLLKFDMTPPPTAPLDAEFGTDLTISPDGRRIVYLADLEGADQLYVRSLDELIARPIPGTEDANRDPFFSPDGESIVFVTEADNKLKKVSLSGGQPVTLCDAPGQEGGDWGPDDTIVFSASSGPVTGLYRVSAAGGNPEVLAMPDPESEEGVEYQRPEILPGGNAVLFTIWRRGEDYQTAVMSLETGEQKIVLVEGRQAHYVPTGHLVYAKTENLMAVPFDLEALEVTGDPITLLEGVRGERGCGVDYSLSSNGTLIYVSGETRKQTQLVWVDRRGTMEVLYAIQHNFQEPRFSPDGNRLSVTVWEGEDSDIWIYEIARGILTPLTFEGQNKSAIWTPDGKRVTFSSNRNDEWNISWMPTDGSGAAEELTAGKNPQTPSSWSPDGQVLAFVQSLSVATKDDILLLPLEGERKPQAFLETQFGEKHPVLSPDGRWIAFSSDPSGPNEVYVKSFSGEGGMIQVSTDGGTEPVWAPDGKELFYRNQDRVMAVSVQTGPTFQVQTPTFLFEEPYLQGSTLAGGTVNYDVSPDGQRFVMLKGEEGSQQSHITVVINWFEELKRLVPTK